MTVEINPTGDPEIGKAVFGDSNGAVTIDTEGVICTGTATRFEDIFGGLIGKRLYSTVGRVDYDYGNAAIKFQDGGDKDDYNDTLIFSIQKPHGAKTDSKLHMHIHWLQDTTRSNVFTIQYRVQKNGYEEVAPWTSIEVTIGDGGANDLFTYTSGTLNQISKLVDIDWSAAPISSIINIKITRTDSNGGDVIATYIDGHVEYDSDGSRTEWVK